jgi:hypothetical protein
MFINFETYIRDLREKNRYDPRQDLWEDSNYWKIVLKEAEKISQEVYGFLHGFRCGGAKLNFSDGKIKMRPRLGSRHAWETKQKYEKDKKEFLVEHKQDIIKVFKKASKIIGDDIDGNKRVI